MNKNEGMRRIVIVIRAIGVLIAALGIIGVMRTSPADQIAVAIMTAVFAVPFFVVAWIVDGFASRDQK